MSKNPVVFWEIASHDAERTTQFLKDLLDWDIELDENSGIYEIPAGPPIGGGVFTLRKARLPFLTIYIQVDDVEGKARLAEELGALIVVPPQQSFPGGPTICLFNEPSGVTLGMLERAAKSA